MARHARHAAHVDAGSRQDRLEQTPLVNHWWNVPLYVSARGLTTSAMPYEDRIFEIEFDFIDHELLIKCSDGSTTTLELRPQSVADFYAEVMAALREFGNGDKDLDHAGRDS